MYAKRFCYQVWRDLLQLVQTMAGVNLPCPAVSRFNSQDTSSGASGPLCTITQAMCSVLPRIPDVAKNPALNHEVAIKDLSSEILTLVGPVVAAWAVRHCEISLRPESLAEADGWPVSTIEMVRSERAKFLKLVEAASSPRSLVSVNHERTPSRSPDASSPDSPPQGVSALEGNAAPFGAEAVLRPGKKVASSTRFQIPWASKGHPPVLSLSREDPLSKPPSPIQSTGAGDNLRNGRRTLLHSSKASWMHGQVARSSAA